ncbi:pleckstrin homology-like domain family A member 3 [Platysternon megacephalum]|uniref:Pleckstrin homology-like domain family A member 3 n=1 Tax=Platysternon megacephalum TaxID=55544 RepID=A0A4D9DYS3_9SAUR|nr:pleckstrin homology-like domain family A member 3 [Platysternon megacephalum]
MSIVSVELVGCDSSCPFSSICKQRNIPRLIYTSTVNVVFGGNPIEEGDEETVPYFPLEKQVNHYSRTKAMAEQMILAANGTPLKGGDKLHTCVLRPPGIYGPEEQKHLPRVLKNIQRGLFNFKFGNPKTQMNWVHVGNLVQAHLLAAEALTPEKGYIASGQAYYIHDGEKVIFSEWITPLFEKLGYSKPWICIPVFLVYIAATVTECLHLALKPVFSFTPFLTRNEVWNITVTHTFRIDKARDAASRNQLPCDRGKYGHGVTLRSPSKAVQQFSQFSTFCVKNQQIENADVRDYDALFAICEGADCVFHAAAYGMSGLEQLQKEKIESINVGGTKLIIEVCKQQNIPRLIYTSTVNVVFGGNPIEDGDEETVPYFPLEKHIDHYSKTKSIADQMVLAANGTPVAGGDKLRTCVLRPPGIYGPGEQRHLPRVAVNIQKGLFRFRFGDPSAKMNWVHVQNLVQAHILAAVALTSERNYIASGQAYYINDGKNVNLFEWITPLFEKLGCSPPWIRIPTCFVYVAATTMEYLHLALKPVIEFTPLLTRNEVWNIAVTHTFRIDKARNQLVHLSQKQDKSLHKSLESVHLTACMITG